MYSFLLSAAEVSNIVSVLTVLFCFCVMILFISRHMVQGREEHNDFRQNFSLNIPRTDLVPIRIPFTFKLLEKAGSSYSGLQCVISSEVTYKLGIYWGVNIKEFHFFLRRPWADIMDCFGNKSFLEGNCQYSKDCTTEDSHPEKEMTISYTDNKPLDLGSPPRPNYPLVIVLLQSGNFDGGQEDNQVALVNIIHIKDPVCTLQTCILAQYLKQSNGQLSCLKQLYLSAGGPVADDIPIPMSVPEAENILSDCKPSDQESESCIVCQYYPLSRAILPCRHACVCAKCFSRLDRCPICRGPIKSFFCIRTEDYINVETAASKESVRENRWSFQTWLENWDDRITDFLGFRR